MRIINILLVVLSLVISALLAEVAFRIIVDNGMVYELEMWKYAKKIKMRSSELSLGHVHRPNASAVLMGADVKTDSHGFRGEDIAPKADPVVARIAFIGDSITFGWGVPEHETFPNRVLQDLRSRGRHVDGFNMGIGNYNTSQELAWLKNKGLQLKPDIIVLAYFINDAEPTPKYLDTNWLSWNSAAWTVLNYRLDTILRSGGSRLDWKGYYRELYRDTEPGWVATRQAVKGISEVAKASGAELIAFNIPELRELNPYPFELINSKLELLMLANRIPFVNLLPSVADQEPASLWVTVPDPHPNGKANALFSTEITKNLLPLLDRLCTSKGKGC